VLTSKNTSQAKSKNFIHLTQSSNMLIFASNLELAPWNRELGEGDHTSCIPQGERSSNL
jgi:hypothetical protein